MPTIKVISIPKCAPTNCKRYTSNVNSTLSDDPDRIDDVHVDMGNVVAKTPEEVTAQFADLRREWDPKQRKPAERQYIHFEVSYDMTDEKTTPKNCAEHFMRFMDIKETRDWQHTGDMHLPDLETDEEKRRNHFSNIHIHGIANIMKLSGSRIDTNRMCERWMWRESDKIARDMGMKIVQPKSQIIRNLTPEEVARIAVNKETQRTKCFQLVTEVLKDVRGGTKIADLHRALKKVGVRLVKAHKRGLIYGYENNHFSASRLGGPSLQLAGLFYISELGYEKGTAKLTSLLDSGKKMVELNNKLRDEPDYYMLDEYTPSEDEKVEEKQASLEDVLENMREFCNSLEQFKEEAAAQGVTTMGSEDFTYQFNAMRTTQFVLSRKFHRDALEKYFAGKPKTDSSSAGSGGGRAYTFDRFSDRVKPAEVQEDTRVHGDRRKPK